MNAQASTRFEVRKCESAMGGPYFFVVDRHLGESIGQWTFKDQAQQMADRWNSIAEREER